MHNQIHTHNSFDTRIVIGTKTMKKNDKKTNLSLNPNKKHKYQNKITKGYVNKSANKVFIMKHKHKKNITLGKVIEGGHS
jgi:hypothetical protein